MKILSELEEKRRFAEALRKDELERQRRQAWKPIERKEGGVDADADRNN